MRVLEVVFRNNESQKLVGKLLIPDKKKEKYETIIFCHGLAANKDLHFFPYLSEKLVEEGFAVLRFDCRSCGESEGKYHPTYLEAINDLESAIKFIKKQPNLSLYGLIGHSMGGTAVLMSASKHDEIKVVIAFAPVAFVKELCESKKNVFEKKGEDYLLKIKDKKFLFSKKFFIDSEEVNVLEAVKKIRARTLLFYGDKDVNVTRDNIEAVIKNSNAKLEEIKGSDHMFKGFYEEITNKTILFIKEEKD